MTPTPTYQRYFDAASSLPELERLVLQYMDDKGFDRPNRDTIPRYLMLVVSELVEALEAIRDEHWDLYVAPDSEGRMKPEGFGVELVQALIRILHITAAMHINVQDLLALSMRYNELRPYKHGRQW